MKKIFLLLLALPIWAQANIFIDPEDHYVDASQWLLEHSGFLPIPIIITEPAVGFGGGAALIFMDKNPDRSPTEKFAPPTIKGIAAFGTDNGSKGASLFYTRNWDKDRWRYRGVLGAASMNLDFYGMTGYPGLENAELHYNLEGFFLMQDLRRRFGDSAWFIGLRYIYSKLDASFDGSPPPFLTTTSITNRNGGLAGILSYDSRDNTMSPQKGIQGELRYYTFSDALGGNLDYNLTTLDIQGFWEWNKHWGGASRLLTKWTDGNAPFYAKPYIDLRGIAKQRYQGDIAGSAELEFRWRPHLRWQYSVFGGLGKADTDKDLFKSSETAGAYGIGMRYLIARLVGFQVGLDLARGPEETVFYIQAGGAWF